ncbi:MAG: aminoacyl-histidine dipeptidase [Thermoplasmata archaeon]|nr:aminoacyl-histidine dipeptidase [Thermoplasmata archaeon]
MYVEDISDLEPREIWRFFDDIRRIPRCSKHEEKAAEYVVNFARESGLSVERDAVGNVLVKKPASPGKENAPTVVLQSHLDMVCEKNREVEHDFSRDPIRLDIRDGWLYARGTTLGADDGIGVATALGILDSKELVHGPVEALFTVDEETGLTGAFALQPGFLEGRIMINLDSEEDGTIYVGCAGGGDTHLSLPVKREPTPGGWTPAIVKVRGLRGGHSGGDIHEQRGNAIKILTRVLLALGGDVRIAVLEGGDKHNAIPREAHAVVYVPDLERARGMIEKMASSIKEEYSKIDPGLEVLVEKGESAPTPLSEGSTSRVLELLNALPHGVLKMSYDIEGLVQTSTNLAAVRLEEEAFKVHTSSRSSVASELEETRRRIESIGILAGAGVEHTDAYPGWKPNLDSRLLAVAKESYASLFGKEPEVKAIHAGLETGVIGEKYPGMDMISIGPEIQNPHSPDERVDIESVGRFWLFVSDMLKRLAE